MNLYNVFVKRQGSYYVAANDPLDAQTKLLNHLQGSYSKWDIETISIIAESAKPGDAVFNNQKHYIP